jgi:hypothetical protein
LQALLALLALLALVLHGAAPTSTTFHAGSSHWSNRRVFTCDMREWLVGAVQARAGGRAAGPPVQAAGSAASENVGSSHQGLTRHAHPAFRVREELLHARAG